MDIVDGFVHLMNDSGGTREDLKLPEGDIGKEIKEKHDNDEQFMVTVLCAMGEEKLIAIKNMTV